MSILAILLSPDQDVTAALLLTNPSTSRSIHHRRAWNRGYEAWPRGDARSIWGRLKQSRLIFLTPPSPRRVLEHHHRHNVHSATESPRPEPRRLPIEPGSSAQRRESEGGRRRERGRLWEVSLCRSVRVVFFSWLNGLTIRDVNL
jgi:hypothetical protein